MRLPSFCSFFFFSFSFFFFFFFSSSSFFFFITPLSFHLRQAEEALLQNVEEAVMAEEDSFGSQVVGNVSGRECLIVDDIIDTIDPWLRAAALLRKETASKVYLVATHCLMTDADAAKLQSLDMIDGVVVTNTVNQQANLAVCPKMQVVDVAPLLAEATRRIFFNESTALIGSSYS